MEQLKSNDGWVEATLKPEQLLTFLPGEAAKHTKEAVAAKSRSSRAMRLRQWDELKRREVEAIENRWQHKRQAEVVVRRSHRASTHRIFDGLAKLEETVETAWPASRPEVKRRSTSNRHAARLPLERPRPRPSQRPRSDVAMQRAQLDALVDAYPSRPSLWAEQPEGATAGHGDHAALWAQHYTHRMRRWTCKC